MKPALKVLIFLAFVGLSCNTYAQQLVFCHGVDTSGRAIRQAYDFHYSSDGSYVNMLVRLDEGVKSKYVNYDIYFVSGPDHEVFDNTLRQRVNPDWKWFSSEFTFQFPGTYRVYVYNDSDHLICNGEVVIRR